MDFDGELPDFHPIRPIHLDIILGQLRSRFSFVDMHKHKPGSFHMFVCLDVCFIISCLCNHVWQGKKTNHSIHGQFSAYIDRFGFVGFTASYWIGTDKPNFLSRPFTLMFGNVLFAFFYLALPFIFMFAVDLGLMKIRK